MIFLSSISFAYSQEPMEIKVTGRFNQTPFVEFVKELEGKYDLHFYYKDEWVKNLVVNATADSIPIEKLITDVLTPSLLDFVFTPPGTIILLPDKQGLSELPDYKTLADTLNQPLENKAGTQEKYLVGRQPDMAETIVIGSRTRAKQGKAAEIKGKIIDDETDEPLTGCTMYIPELKKGLASDSNGLLYLNLNPGIYSAVFKQLGLQELKCILDVRSDGNFQIRMKKQIHALKEFMVKGNEGNTRGSKAGLENVSVKAMKEIPSLLGEKDIIRIAQMLPGIVSVGEGSAGINVRGGNADQNLFYINRVPIYNTAHLFGFFTAINSEIVDNFSVYKGQVPVEFGGRLSSVFDIETRKGNKTRFFTQGGVSPISANAEVEFPLVKERLSVMVSGRSSYSDWILGRLDDPDLRNSSASFSDFAGNLSFQSKEKTKINLFAYQSHDNFNLNDYTEYAYGNRGASLNFEHKFSKAIKSELSFIASNYQYETIEKKFPAEAYTHNYSLDHYEAKAVGTLIPGEKHTIKFGADMIRYELNRGSVSPFGKESLRIGVDLGKEQGIESSVFLDENFSATTWLSMYAGMRYSMFSYLGPNTVRSYFPGVEMTNQSVSGTETFTKDQKITSYQNPEIRAGIDLKFSQESSLKLAVTQMSQYLFMLSNTISIAPNDQWKLVSPNIRPPKSIQYSAGFFQTIKKHQITASAEIYYKEGTDVVEYKDGADFLSTPFVETTILQGKQKAYGAEFMFARNTGSLNGWASYTYSRSLITVAGEKQWQDINLGKEFPSNFDKPHVLNVVLNFKMNRRMSLSSNLIYNTGRPITIPKSAFYIQGQPFVDYSSRNAYRIPDYIRLDVSFKLEGNLRSKKPMHSYWMLSAYNATGRKNANSIFFLSEQGKLHGYKYSVVGVPIITLSWNWKLGNYASE